MKKANTKGNRRAVRAAVAPSNNGSAHSSLAKSTTGMAGLAEITGGGLPQGRPTLVCGSAGAGKTLFAMGFPARRATQYGEPGVFVSFEKKPEELTPNVASLGFDLDKLQRQKKLAIEFVHVEVRSP